MKPVVDVAWNVQEITPSGIFLHGNCVTVGSLCNGGGGGGGNLAHSCDIHFPETAPIPPVLED